MTDLRQHLQSLIEAERRSPGPGPDAVAACWQRIAADVERGASVDIDVPPPSKPRNTALWVTLTLLGAGVLAGAGYLIQRTTLDAPSLREAAELPLPEPPRPATPRRPGVPDFRPPAPADPPPTPAPPAADTASPEAHAAAAKPRPKRTSTSPSAESDSPAPDTFAAELRLLAQGQAALGRDDYPEALRISNLYRKTYPKGHFVEDSDALRVVAQCATSAPHARRAAFRFLATYSNSIHVPRIHDACPLPPPPPESH